jgi:hypothetical protein
VQPYFPPSRDDASIIVILRSCVDVAQDVASFKRHAAASPAVPPPMIAMRSGRGGSHVAVHEQDGGQVMVSRPLTTLCESERSADRSKFCDEHEYDKSKKS